MTRRGRRGLTKEDREIWDQVRRTVRPLDPGSESAAKAKQEPAPVSDPRPAKAKAPPSPRPAPEQLRALTIGGKATARPDRHILQSPVEENVASAALAMDARKHKRMLRGKETPEARIDLHGLTLARAHPELIDFILTSYARGLRLVLVITGKGKVKDEAGPMPTPIGVLRNQVPRWLGMAPLKPVILQVRSAHQSHGGGGAYYVYLKRR